MMTRNHEKYLEQAVQSVLDQDFNEAVENLIGEDCSNDETLAVAFDLQRRFPDVIRVISADHMLASLQNF